MDFRKAKAISYQDHSRVGPDLFAAAAIESPDAGARLLSCEYLTLGRVVHYFMPNSLEAYMQEQRDSLCLDPVGAFDTGSKKSIGIYVI